MSRELAALIVFGILFIIVFVFDYFFVKRRYLKKKKKGRKKSELIEIAYLVGKFQIDIDKVKMNILLIVTSLINAFIIALVSVTILLIRINIFLQLIIGFILLLALIYSLYEILGRHLIKKGYVKNES